MAGMIFRKRVIVQPDYRDASGREHRLVMFLFTFVKN
jgi:hypothetical protein